MDMYGLMPSRPEDYQGMCLDRIRQRWDRKADRWDADLADERCHLNEDGAYARFLASASAIVADRGEFCRERLLVDLACGTGLVLAYFVERFAEGLGVDISRRMLGAARRRRVPRSRFQECNAFELAQFAPQAGAVLSRGVLLSHYGHRWASILFQQIDQALVPGGFGLLDFLNAEARHLYASNPDNKSYFTPHQLEQLAEEAGFRHTRVLGEPTRRVRLVLLER